MDGNIWGRFLQLLNAWQNNKLVLAIAAAVVSSLLTLAAVFFRQLWRAFAAFIKWIWAIVHKRGKDYAFEREYLNWLIDQHRFLGLLPANTVTALWGEEGRTVDLEKVYINLSVSTENEDQMRFQNSADYTSSWRRQSWFYRPFNYYFFTLCLIYNYMYSNDKICGYPFFSLFTYYSRIYANNTFDVSHNYYNFSKKNFTKSKNVSTR